MKVTTTTNLLLMTRIVRVQSKPNPPPPRTFSGTEDAPEPETQAAATTTNPTASKRGPILTDMASGSEAPGLHSALRRRLDVRQWRREGDLVAGGGWSSGGKGLAGGKKTVWESFVNSANFAKTANPENVSLRIFRFQRDISICYGRACVVSRKG